MASSDEVVVAEWLRQTQLKGNRRSITVGPDRVAIVITDGVYGRPHIEERIDARGRFGFIRSRSGIEVLVANLSPFQITYELDETSGDRRNPAAIVFGMPVLTHDDMLVAGDVRLTLGVSRERPGLLYQLRRGKTKITAADVAFAIRDEFVAQVIRTRIAQIDSSDLRDTQDQFSDLYGEHRFRLQNWLERFGLELLNFTLNLLPLKKMTSAERELYDRRLERAPREAELARTVV